MKYTEGKKYPKWDCKCKDSYGGYEYDEEDDDYMEHMGHMGHMGMGHMGYMDECCMPQKCEKKCEKECVKTYTCTYKLYRICCYKLYKVCPRCRHEFDYHRHGGMCPKCSRMY